MAFFAFCKVIIEKERIIENILNSLRDLLKNILSVHIKYIFNMDVKLLVN